MHRLFSHLVSALLLAISAVQFVGCGTTRSTDTGRTATEQLLISDAIDRAVQSVNLRTLSGQTVFLDDSRLGDAVDRNYLISSLRQHLLANGCALQDQRDQADFIVEARAGAIGTDRSDLLFGVPSMNVPQIMPLQPVPAAIPEIPIAKRRDQKGIAKLAVFAYHRETGTPVWQSGLVHQESSANDVWILGAGPFQRGSIHDGTSFAGKTLGSDDSDEEPVPRRLPAVELTQARTFTPPQRLAKGPGAVASGEQSVVQASHNGPEQGDVDNTAVTPADSPVTAPLTPDAPQTSSPPQSPAITAQPETSPPAGPPSVYAPSGSTTLPTPRFSSR